MRPDAQRPSTWKLYRNGMCDGCWAGCCTLPVEASAADLVRLGVLEEIEAAQISKAIVRRLQKQGILDRYVQKTGIFLLAQRSNSDCVYLDAKTRLCTVYERRPEVCRQFPKIGPRPGFCPGAPQAREAAR